MALKPERKHRRVYKAQAKQKKNKPLINKDLSVDFLQSRHTKANRKQRMPCGCCFFFPLAFTNKWLRNWRAGVD